MTVIQDRFCVVFRMTEDKLCDGKLFTIVQCFRGGATDLVDALVMANTLPVECQPVVVCATAFWMHRYPEMPLSKLVQAEFWSRPRQQRLLARSWSN